MTKEQIKDGKELLELIGTTENALKRLKAVPVKDEKLRDNKFDDGVYSFFIGEYSDGSGFGNHLDRYKGNFELLNVIIDTLETQLKEFQKAFDEL